MTNARFRLLFVPLLGMRNAEQIYHSLLCLFCLIYIMHGKRLFYNDLMKLAGLFSFLGFQLC